LTTIEGQPPDLAALGSIFFVLARPSRRGGDIDNPGHPRIIGIASGSVRRPSTSLPELFAT